uniref:Uridine kinase n=4 Tax=Parascaris univalens TaxID=6257 RepID=A0A915BI45_PARUN
MRPQEEHRVKIADLLPKSCASSGSSVNEMSSRSRTGRAGSSPPSHAIRRRNRTISGSKSEDHLLTTESGRLIYTKGRPPWYDREGKNLKQPYVIGICGGSASGKTTVARRIIERLEVPWVTVLSMDSFYKVLSEDQHQLAARHEYNFDHPQAFDFDLLCETLRRLRDGKSVEVPVYDFTTHRRDKQPKLMYGADVLIFEGILAFHTKELIELMDMKVFVDTDPDTRLVRRLKRDTEERGRKVEGILEQYLRFVKPAFDTFIAPGMKCADIIVPRGGENEVAIDLIVKQVKTQLAERGYDASKNPNLQRADMVHRSFPHQLPSSLHIVPQTPQVRGLHTFIRNRKTPRDEFIFYSERLMRILIENAMNFMPFKDVSVETPSGKTFSGKRCTAVICGVAIMRAGETMENSLRAVVKDCKMGKILIQTNERTMEPELYYLRLPKNVQQYKILLMDATVATGAAAMMAIRILLDHDVLEENIILISLLMAETGVHSLAYAFPKVTLLTTAVDAHISESYYVIPGMGNFGDRYFGTEAVAFFDDNSDTEDAATQNTDECSNSNNDDRGNGTETAYANNLQSTDANRNQNKSNEGDCGKCFDVEISQKSLDLDSPQSSGYGSNIQENITDDSPDTEPNYQSSSQ